MPTPKCHSVLKSVALLKAFRETDGWVTAGQLSKRVGIPESSGYRLINTLVDLGMVLRGSNGYRLGANLLSLSRIVSVDECLKVASKDILMRLATGLQTTVHLARLDEEMVLYVAKAATPHSCAVPINCGSRFEPYSSASGKLLLSSLQPEALESCLKGDLIALTPQTITNKRLLTSELSEIQRAGFASDDGQFHVNVSSIAVPVRDCGGRVVASVSASEVPASMTPARRMLLRDSLMTAAEAIALEMYKGRRTAPPNAALPFDLSTKKDDVEAYV